MRKKKKLQKNPSNYYLWKVKKFHGDSVTNESTRAKKLEEGAPNAPPPSLSRVKKYIRRYFLKFYSDKGLKGTIVNQECTISVVAATVNCTKKHVEFYAERAQH